VQQALRAHDDLALARRLVDAIEAGDAAGSRDLIRALHDGRFEALFNEIGKLTRELHDTFAGLCADQRLLSIAQLHMPDARARLEFVIEKTAAAADRTLGAVETMIPLSDQLVNRAVELRQALAREDDVAVLRERACDYLDSAVHGGRKLRTGLTEVLMAQEFQDITGQVIRRTIDLVSQVEEKLVELVSACGAVAANLGTRPPGSGPAQQSRGPAVRQDEQVLRHQDEVDELLANLGF
jgi:chemotaxis protein CheZ